MGFDKLSPNGFLCRCIGPDLLMQTSLQMDAPCPVLVEKSPRTTLPINGRAREGLSA
jgi:hypothetical protein